MRKSILFILFAVFQILSGTSLYAQSSAVKKAGQSVFTLTTFKADGSIHGSSYGVFVGSAGEGIAMWHLFDGAEQAVIVDAKGKKHDVDVMLGVSELYDICQFRVKDMGSTGLPLPTSDAAAKETYLVGYDLKKSVVKKLKPLRSEKFMTTNNYYVFNDVDVSNTDLGSPLLNEQGELLGIMQRHKNGGQAYSADARLINTFKLNGLSINDRTMRATGIRPALPTDEQQAVLMLMVAGQQTDSIKYEAYINDFISQFPTATDGYKALAARYVLKGDLGMADKTLEREVKNAAQKDLAYNDYAQAMYTAVAFKRDTTFTKWNYQKALELAQNAYQTNPLPSYKHLQAKIIYAQGDYQKALEMFTELQKTDLGKNGEVFYEAAQCKKMLNSPSEDVVALLDAAATAQNGLAAAPYILARGQYYDRAGEYRKAFADYLAYDTLINNRGTHDFYYTKFLCEKKIRQYKLALNDIAHAIVLNRTEPTYYAEMASLQLQLNQVEDAIMTCDMGLKITQEYSDLYIIKGIAQCENKDKTNGLSTLQKAHELGDTRAQGLIEKYSKNK
ncbi:trypsin-like peptidase domain-containing protein [Hallella bergensis]|uniref:trypsin-like peptidase domain-containing protein n=1 Tax=Hallella bergensis TaxID=242750 RepID=UPI003990928A